MCLSTALYTEPAIFYKIILDLSAEGSVVFLFSSPEKCYFNTPFLLAWLTYIILTFDAPLLLICDPVQKMSSNYEYIENTVILQVIFRDKYRIFISPSPIVKRVDFSWNVEVEWRKVNAT